MYFQTLFLIHKGKPLGFRRESQFMTQLQSQEEAKSTSGIQFEFDAGSIIFLANKLEHIRTKTKKSENLVKWRCLIYLLLINSLTTK